MSETSSKKRKLSLPLVLAGGVSSLVLALGMSPTFSAFTALIVNTGNTAGMGTLTMLETTKDGTGPNSCSSGWGSANCTTINKYGGSITMVPGTPVATDIAIKNTGSVAASSFSLYFGACSNTPTGVDLCSKMLVEVKSGTKVLTPAGGITAASLATTYPQATPIDIKAALGGSPIVGGTSAVAIPFTITVTMPSTSGTGDNAFQGASISQAMTWSFQS